MEQYSITLMFITNNRKNELLRALKSCIPYMNYKMEIIVVDNNSKDGSQEEIERYLQSYSVNYLYHYSHENLGVAGGRNVAFKLAKGKYIFSLDDDAIIVTKDIFNKITKFMDRNPEVAALGLNIYEPSTKRTILEKTAICKNKEYQLLLNFAGGGHVLRREFYSQKPFLYPEKLKFGSEELYACLYAWANNMTVAYVPEFKVNHLPTVNQLKGKERNINILVNIFIIRLLMFPQSLIYIEYLFFTLRLTKNGYLNSKDLKTIKDYVKERYVKEERDKISLKNLLKLCKLFGIQKIL